MAKTKKLLLDINTALAPDPDIIRINGVNYDMRPIRTMGIKEQVTFEQIGNKAARITSSDEEIPPEHIKQLEDMTDGMLSEIMPDLPADVMAKLDYIDKQAIIQTFTAASEAARAALKTPDHPPTSGKPSQTSNASTAEGS